MASGSIYPICPIVLLSPSAIAPAPNPAVLGGHRIARTWVQILIPTSSLGDLGHALPSLNRFLFFLFALLEPRNLCTASDRPGPELSPSPFCFPFLRLSSPRRLCTWDLSACLLRRWERQACAIRVGSDSFSVGVKGPFQGRDSSRLTGSGWLGQRSVSSCRVPAVEPWRRWHR